LNFPVRSAAVDDFLRSLKAHGSADLNAVMATLNDGDLCRETQRRWEEAGWIRVAPHSPLTALTGPEFSPEITLLEFCGRPSDEPPDFGDPQEAAEGEVQEEEKDDEHS
jgi:hypothetical protein